jgi:hypothetical protein
MAVQVNMAEAKAKLSSLLDQGARGRGGRDCTCRRSAGSAHSGRKHDATQAWCLARFEYPE